MKPAPPRIRIGHSLFRADTCRPLCEAAERGEILFRAFARSQYPGRRLAPKVLPGLLSAGFWDAGSEQAWGLPEHRNEGLELTYLEAGELAFRCGSTASRLHPGDLTVTRPWQPHSLGSPNITAGRLHFLILDLGVRRPHQRWCWPAWLALQAADLRELTGMLRENERTVWRAAPEMGASFAAIARLAAEPDSARPYGSRLSLLVGELLLGLLEMLRGRVVPRRQSLTNAERSVQQFLRELEGDPSAAWTVDSMAAQCGLKRTRLAHYCRKLTNRTPSEHLNFVRIARAKNLLARNPERPITDIALDCGFSTSQYFSAVFRQFTGSTPSHFRAKLHKASEILLGFVPHPARVTPRAGVSKLGRSEKKLNSLARLIEYRHDNAIPH